MRYSEIVTEVVLNTVNPYSKKTKLIAQFNDAYSGLDLKPTNVIINGFNVYLHYPEATEQEKLEVLLTKGSDIVGVMRLIREPHGKGEFVFSDIRFDPSAQGGDTALKMYIYVITKLGYTIVSDDTQSLGGASIWKRLAKTASVLVYQWDPVSDKYTAWDPNDSDSAYLNLDDANGAEEENERIRDHLDTLLDQGKIDYDEYGSLLTKMINPINAELDKMDKASEYRLVATRRKGLKQ